MRLADVSSRVNEVAQRYQVPERFDAVKEKVGDLSGRMAGKMSAAGYAAYRLARENPRSSIAGAVLAAALVGGLLWYLFGDEKRPVERRRRGKRVRAVSERRRRHASAR